MGIWSFHFSFCFVSPNKGMSMWIFRIPGLIYFPYKMFSMHLWKWKEVMALDCLSALLSFCEGNPPVTIGFPWHRYGYLELSFFFLFCKPQQAAEKKGLELSTWRHWNELSSNAVKISRGKCDALLDIVTCCYLKWCNLPVIIPLQKYFIRPRNKYEQWWSMNNDFTMIYWCINRPD